MSRSPKLSLAAWLPNLLTLLLLSAVPLLLGSCSSEESGLSNGMHKTQASDGVEIVYEISGAGDTTLVLVHCWACDRNFWDFQTDEMRQSYRVVTIDLAGHGESGSGRNEMTIEAFADDVATVIGASGLQNVVLVGHSMGGPVSLAAAGLLPDVVIGVIGVDAFHDFTEERDEEAIIGFLKDLNQNFVGYANAMVRQLFPPECDTVLRANVAHAMSQADPAMATSALDHLLHFDKAAAARALSVPIRCIVSESPYYPMRAAENRQVAPNFDFLSMRGTGHFLHMERPEEFNALLFRSIESLSEPISAPSDDDSLTTR